MADLLRVLSADAVQKAGSGHPGMPMGMAEIAYVLWKFYLKHNPKNPIGLTEIGSYYRMATDQCYITHFCI